ncbi:hypothetical protein [Streptomyces osmaniensis]|uniref:Uncharacterized protein n=1 Tax=Streptomyces osmaniensis TaxID=593134 RepID=A0ABP6Z2N5_9ACTN
MAIAELLAQSEPLGGHHADQLQTGLLGEEAPKLVTGPDFALGGGHPQLRKLSAGREG